jgi:hypothetical protein
MGDKKAKEGSPIVGMEDWTDALKFVNCLSVLSTQVYLPGQHCYTGIYLVITTVETA